MSANQEVYFAACLGPFGQPIGAYKIGCSFGRDLRLKSIASSLPFSLELVAAVPGGYVTEALCHLYLREHRIRGEYYHVNAATDAFVLAAKERGTAFRYINDTAGTDIFGASARPALDAFMKFHGVTLDEACLYLGADPARYRKQPKGYSRHLAAAAALVAQRRENGRYVNWPMDGLRGLCGEFHHAVRPALLAAPEEEARAA